MGKTLKSNEVIKSLTKKIELKKELRIAKKQDDEVQVKHLQKQIESIESKLSNTPLSKT